jgi:hypothetical protein
LANTIRAVMLTTSNSFGNLGKKITRNVHVAPEASA